MIEDLDRTIENLLKQGAAAGSELAQADITFDIPDREWRQQLDKLTLNCYLYGVDENLERRTQEPLLKRVPTGGRRVEPPVRIDCSYCITAWSIEQSTPVFEEHRLLGQALRVLLRNRTIPQSALAGSLVDQIPPYPTLIASGGGRKNDPDFWGALDQKLKPSLNYVVCLAMFVRDEATNPTALVETVDVHARAMSERG